MPSRTARTPIGVLSFCNLFVPRAAAEGSEPRFSVNIILNEAAQKTPEYADLRKLVLEAIDEKWPGKSKDASFVRALRLPFRNCSDREYAGYDVPNGKFIAPWSKIKPGIVDARNEDIEVPGDVWAGQTGRATVHAFAYANSGNKGVSFQLHNVQVVNTTGIRLDGRKPANQDFDPVDDGSGLVDADADDAPF